MARRGTKKKREPVGDPSDPHGMASWIAHYLEWLRSHNYSDSTVNNRESYLMLFCAWCEERGITRPSEITKPILERYQRHLYHYRKPKDGQPLSFRSQYARLVPIRALFKWLTRQNVLLYNPASELELPRLEHRLPKHVLNEREAHAVLMQADTSDPLGIRDRAILETLYSTGMRRMELVILGLYDLDLERGTLMVRQGKGKKDRMVPIGERAAVWIEKYRADVRHQLVVEPDDGTLFLTADGARFSPNGMTSLARNYVLAADTGKRGACHLFRHTMATLMLENGADIRFIQEMLGHAKLETTQIYTQVSIKKLQEIHRATHPTARHERTPSKRIAEAKDTNAHELRVALEAEASDEEQL
jgi:integrase/recombinase XerD